MSKELRDLEIPLVFCTAIKRPTKTKLLSFCQRLYADVVEGLAKFDASGFSPTPYQAATPRVVRVAAPFGEISGRCVLFDIGRLGENGVYENASAVKARAIEHYPRARALGFQ